MKTLRFGLNSLSKLFMKSSCSPVYHTGCIQLVSDAMLIKTKNGIKFISYEIKMSSQSSSMVVTKRQNEHRTKTWQLRKIVVIIIAILYFEIVKRKNEELHWQVD